MRTGRPKAPLVLTEPKRHALEGLARRARTAPQVARRARIVLACERGLDNQTVAKKLQVSAQIVGRWRARLSSGGRTMIRIGQRLQIPTIN